MKPIITIILTIAVFYSSHSQKLSNDSLKYKIGQMVMIGFRDTVITDSSHILSDIKNLNIGGVVLYEYDAPSKSRPRNITSATQLKILNKKLQEHAKTPLFIGIDEEGGRVTRLKKKYGFKPTVSAQYLGSLNNTDTTILYAKQIALACKQMGINLNFAPVIDVNINPQCPVIGGIERSFSNKPNIVTKHANIFIEEHKKNGVLCSLKHFPGHGSSKNDSHQGFTDVSDTWLEIELDPYKNILSANSYPLVMTSHVFNRKIDSIYPATLSKATIDVLRNDINYQGVILSDDMMMLAVSENFGLKEAIKKSINAGVDMLIFSNNIDNYDANIARKVIDTLTELVNKGEIPIERINESLEKISQTKTRINK